MYTETDTINLPVSRAMEIALPVIGFVVPFVISGPQILTGTAVNALLVLYALTYPTKRNALMCAMPGLGAVSNGLVFGTLTPYLLYFLPCIWLGNMVLVGSVRLGNARRILASVVVGAFFKSALLFSAAFALVTFHVVPLPFLTAMGALQFITAFLGGCIAIGVWKIITSRYA